MTIPSGECRSSQWRSGPGTCAVLYCMCAVLCAVLHLCGVRCAVLHLSCAVLHLCGVLCAVLHWCAVLCCTGVLCCVALERCAVLCCAVLHRSGVMCCTYAVCCTVLHSRWLRVAFGLALQSEILIKREGNQGAGRLRRNGWQLFH